MHEAAIAADLIAAASAAVAREGARGRIVRLEVTAGRLSGVSVEALRFAFEQLAAGTPAAGAELVVTEPKAACRCASCGAQSETEDLFAPCPVCGSSDVTITGGRELLLQSVDIDQ